MWKRLDHVNIVPFKGATFEPLRLVSEWMDHGELREYLRKNHDADLLDLVSTSCRCSVCISLQTSSHPITSYSVLLMASFTFTHAILFMEISKEYVESRALTNPCSR